MTNPMMQSVAAIARRKANAGAASNQVVTSTPPTSATRNDFSGWVGYSFTIASSKTITSLSRWSHPSSVLTHDVKIWDNSGTEVATATLTVSGLGSAQWVDQAITPVVLTAGTYVVASQEFDAGDLWHAQEAGTLAAGFTLGSSRYGTGSWANIDDTAGNIFVPCGFIFE